MNDNILADLRESGFTLVELLITVAIVAVLASIVIPEMKEYRARAIDAVTISDLINAQTALHLYLTDDEAPGVQFCENKGCGDRFGHYGMSISNSTDEFVIDCDSPCPTKDDFMRQYRIFACSNKGTVDEVQGNTFMMDREGNHGIASQNGKLVRVKKLQCNEDPKAEEQK